MVVDTQIGFMNYMSVPLCKNDEEKRVLARLIEVCLNAEETSQFHRCFRLNESIEEFSGFEELSNRLNSMSNSAFSQQVFWRTGALFCYRMRLHLQVCKVL